MCFRNLKRVHKTWKGSCDQIFIANIPIVFLFTFTFQANKNLNKISYKKGTLLNLQISIKTF